MLKHFHIGDILSVVTSKLLSPRGMAGLYEILNFMAGTLVFTHEIPSLIKKYRPLILNQYPILVSINCKSVSEENLSEWLQTQAQDFGEFLPIVLSV